MEKVKKAKFNKIVALAIIVSAASSPAYGMTLPNSKSPNSQTINSQYYKSGMNIKNKLDNLVTLGNINQFQEDAVINCLLTYKQSLRNSNIDRLSTTGRVSETQKTIIYNLFAAYKDSISKAIKDDFSYKLDGLIEVGTITQLQKNEIMKLYTIYENNTEELIGLDNLVTNTIITKDQENIILNTFMNSIKSTSKTINDILLSKLDKAVLNGTINNDQRSAVINLAKIPTVDSQKLKLQNMLDPLVAEGTITKDHETHILNVLTSE